MLGAVGAYVWAVVADCSWFEDMALGHAGRATVDFGSFLELREISILFKY